MTRLADINLIERLRPRAVWFWRWVTAQRGGEESESSITPVRRRPGVDFSLTGLVYCAMMLFMGLAAITSQANLLFAVFGLMIGILLISAAICRLVLTRLKVERTMPEVASVGQPATIRYDFLNTKRFWPSLSVCLAELEGSEAFTRQPHAYMLHAAAGRSAQVPITVIPKRRGSHKLGSFQISTSFPFGFVKRALTGRSDDTIVIYPAMGAVSSRLLGLCQSAERSGDNMKPRPRGADEFYGVKEFRWGDNPRWIYWKRSARTGELVSREMVQISPPRLLIFVDTFLETATLTEHADVEKGIAMAASLASRAMDTGMSVGLCAWTGKWTTIAPQRGKRHCRDILAALGGLPLNRTAPAGQLIQQGQELVTQDVTTVLITPGAAHSTGGGRMRGGMVVVAVKSEQARSWFQFDPAIDFTRCVPADQLSAIAD
jgi:uncharacterized protein (DUF58 family)